MLGSSSKRFLDCPPGSQIEICPTSGEIAGAIAKLIRKGVDIGGKPSVGGVGLIIDYGGDKAFENSLRVGEHVRIVECTLTFVSLDFDARLSRIITLLTCSLNLGNVILQPT